MAFMLASTFTSALMMACVRAVSEHIHAFEITFFRALFGFIVLLPVLLRHGLAPFRTRRLGLHALRGTVHVTATLLIFLGVTMSPLAKVTALFFSAPLFAAVLALVILGESMRARRVSALVVGFIGTMVVLRPDTGVVEPGVLLVLASAALWGLGLTIIKVLGRTETSVTTTLYMGVFMMPIALAAAIPVWRWPTGVELAWLAAVGGLGGLTHLFLAQAYREAEMTAVLPIDFTRLLWVASIAYVAFGEVPTLDTWLGAVLIFSAATYSSIRESRLAGEQEGRGSG